MAPAIRSKCRVIQSLVHSQAELHSAYGGVFPTLAKREHGKNLAPLLEKTLKDLPSRGTITDQRFKDVIGSFKVELERANPDLWQSLSHAEFLKNIPAIDRIAVTEGPGLEPALWVWHKLRPHPRNTVECADNSRESHGRSCRRLSIAIRCG